MTSREGRVAVILPTISIDRLLDAAVESLLTQTLAEFELIVAHDGVEPDERRWWMRDGRVHAVSSPERRGLAATLNQAIGATSCEYIARLDADDLAEPRRLELQLRFLDEHPRAVACGSHAERIDLDGEATGPFPTSSGSDVRELLLSRNVIVHSSAMFRRLAFHAAGGYDIRMLQMEDYDLWLRLGRLGPLAILDQSLVQYRLHDGQVSRRAEPFGYHMNRVREGRRKLARQLGVSWLRTTALDARWTTAQALRYWGLRAPRYDRNLNKPLTSRNELLIDE